MRNAAVAAFSTLQPATAAKFWPNHPTVEISLGLATIGRATRDRKPLNQRTFDALDDAAAKLPLAPEPFLVRGVEAQMNGNLEAARRSFLAAQRRDPRSLAAAYFLANYYFRTGHNLKGLEQTTLLARLAPGGADAVAPFVAAYAQDRSNWPEMRELFRSQKGLEDQVLSVLARDAQNVDTILAITDVSHRASSSPWLQTLLQSLVAKRDYERARAIWSSVGGGRARYDTLFDQDFSSPGPPPPFNWSLTSSMVGLAERQPGKKLHVIFYGNQDGILASELLLLPAGRYRLQLKFAGAPTHPETLYWSIRCDPSQEQLASISVDKLATTGWTFDVPANCKAQWLELVGRSGDVSQQSDVTITALNLARVADNA